MFHDNDLPNGVEYQNNTRVWHRGKRINADYPLVLFLYKKMYGWIDSRGRFRAAATSKMERFVIIVNGL